MCCDELAEQDAEEEEEWQAALGEDGTGSAAESSLSALWIFLFLGDVKPLSLRTSEAAGLGSWVGGGGVGEGKPVGNMKKRNAKKSN